MTNATIFAPAIIRDSELYNKVKEYFGERFIDIKDFPDGVPIAFQDGELKLTGRGEPINDCFLASFGVKDCSQLDLMDMIIKFSDCGLNPSNVYPPYEWKKVNRKKVK